MDMQLAKDDRPQTNRKKERLRLRSKNINDTRRYINDYIQDSYAIMQSATHSFFKPPKKDPRI
jgi:hypothetical protein